MCYRLPILYHPQSVRHVMPSGAASRILNRIANAKRASDHSGAIRIVVEHATAGLSPSLRARRMRCVVRA